jgi:predicted nucleic acid-binding protein
MRTRAIDFVANLANDSRAIIVPQTSSLFTAGFELFQRRADKLYSFTDCMSMAICHERGIMEILTADHDFEQEGFRILL